MQLYILSFLLLIGTGCEVNATEALELKTVRGLYNGSYEIFGYNTAEFSEGLNKYINDTNQTINTLYSKNRHLEWRINQLDSTTNNNNKVCEEQMFTTNMTVFILLIIVGLVNLPSNQFISK
jgi:hypothetical protein